MDFIEEFYQSYDEEARLLSRHGQVEYLTTMKYIHECLKDTPDPKIIEIGAATGRYSVTLAKEGINVTAVELLEHNLNILRSKLDGSEPIKAMQGNALDLSAFCDGTFDLTLLLGPMYHLFTGEDKVQALSEAVRVTKKGGYIFVAYCMNEPTVVQYIFLKNMLDGCIEKDLIMPDWRLKSDPGEVFDLVRTEDIDSLDAEVNARRIKLIASDGITHYYRELIDGMDDATFSKWLDFHFATCERQDLIGASNHTLDILRKN